MSAPKPKVRCTGSWSIDGEQMYDYTWRCDCGKQFDGHEDWRDVIRDALEHSCTHTAERVADELDRRVEAAYQVAERAADRGDLLATWEAVGNAQGIESAADIVRKSLVKVAT